MTDIHGLVQFVSVVTFASILGIRAFRRQPASHRLMAVSALAVLIAAPVLVSAWPRLLWPIGLESAGAAREWLSTPLPTIWLIGWASIFAAATAVLWRSVTSTRQHIANLPLCRNPSILAASASRAGQLATILDDPPDGVARTELCAVSGK